MIYRYKVRWVDNEYNETISCGFTSGLEDNFGEVVNKIILIYGTDNVSGISVFKCEETIEDEDIEDYKKESF